MFIINEYEKYPIESILFTFALDSEAAEVFSGFNCLITGIGKVNAAYELTKAIQKKRPALVVNLGSAGSAKFKKGELVCCTRFLQRDMDVRPLGYELFETPLSNLPMVLEYGLIMDGLNTGICGTGDTFDTTHSASAYDVVDMEAYALAMISMKESIPFLCIKYISDGANDDAASDWSVEVHNAAMSYGKLFQLGARETMLANRMTGAR